MQRGGVGLGIGGDSVGGPVEGSSVGPVTPPGKGAGSGVDVSDEVGMSVEVTPGNPDAGAVPELLAEPPLQRRYR
jgi:hypothetical protein